MSRFARATTAKRPPPFSLGTALLALLLLLSISSSSFVALAQDSLSYGGTSNSCILPFDVDEVPATAGGLVTATDGTKQELTLADSSAGKLTLSGRLALALPPSSSASSSASTCPTDGKSLLEALPGAKLVAMDGATGLRISPNPVRAKVRVCFVNRKRRNQAEIELANFAAARSCKARKKQQRSSSNLVCGEIPSFARSTFSHLSLSLPPSPTKNKILRSPPSPAP